MTNTNVNGYLLQIQTQITDVEEYLGSDKFYNQENTEVQNLYLNRHYLLLQLQSTLVKISEAEPISQTQI